MRNWLIGVLDRIYGWLEPGYDASLGLPQWRYWRDDGKVYFTLVAGNNEPLVASTQGYASVAAARRGVEAAKRVGAIAEIIGVDKAPKE